MDDGRMRGYSALLVAIEKQVSAEEAFRAYDRGIEAEHKVYPENLIAEHKNLSIKQLEKKYGMSKSTVCRKLKDKASGMEQMSLFDAATGNFRMPD